LAQACLPTTAPAKVMTELVVGVAAPARLTRTTRARPHEGKRNNNKPWLHTIPRAGDRSGARDAWLDHPGATLDKSDDQAANVTADSAAARRSRSKSCEQLASMVQTPATATTSASRGRLAAWASLAAAHRLGR
jgi:hypothetical protein